MINDIAALLEMDTGIDKVSHLLNFEAGADFLAGLGVSITATAVFGSPPPIQQKNWLKI